MAFFRDSFSLGKKASSSSSSVFDLLTIKWEIWSFKECSDSTAAETEKESKMGMKLCRRELTPFSQFEMSYGVQSALEKRNWKLVPITALGLCGEDQQRHDTGW